MCVHVCSRSGSGSSIVEPSGFRVLGIVSVGARVELHSLLRNPEHNGAEGEVVEFDASTGRWRVRLAEPDGRELALRASNLAVLMPASQTLLALGEMPCGADVEMHSLVRSPELNGVRGQVVEPQDPRTGRCGVKIDSDGRVLALKPANLVRLCGNAACRQALAPPLLQCSKCKAKAYCCEACQVGDPATHRAPCARARVCLDQADSWGPSGRGSSAQARWLRRWRPAVVGFGKQADKVLVVVRGDCCVLRSQSSAAASSSPQRCSSAMGSHGSPLRSNLRLALSIAASCNRAGGWHRQHQVGKQR